MPGPQSNVESVATAHPIDTLEALFFAEVQELRSAELQLSAQLLSTAQTQQNEALRNLLQAYATELNSRREDMERLLSAAGINPREHSDQAMKSLLAELVKMSELPVAAVRDAALIDSLQRIVHLKIAAYGSVATFAKMSGRIDDASRFGEYADRERSVDCELTAIATGSANREAFSSQAH
jgi:ferritin-like metal-binding protein YciE